jgi:radical SAM protein with 4Fe4S-binding SPASM domain
MSDEIVYSILDQNINQGFNANVSFMFYNEPTLDKRLLNFIDYANKLNTKVVLTTNGDRIKNSKSYAKEIFSRNIKLYISLYDYKNKDESVRLINNWQNYLNELKINPKQYELNAQYEEFGSRAGLVTPNNFEKKSKLYKSVPLEYDCKKIHSKMNIRFDGEVAICCEDSHVQHSLGNVYEKTLSEIWYGERMKEATKILSEGRRKDITPCNKCIKGIKKVESNL